MMVDVLLDWNAVDINDVLSMIMEESYMIRIMFNTGQCSIWCRRYGTVSC